MNLVALDYVMICVPLLVVTAIALAMRPYMRSVADFLAANRCAGRYVICTSTGIMGGAVMTIVVAMESFYKTGFSINMWQAFSGIILFMFMLLGVMTYRFRETRCLTFHQFFEVRYSKSMRVFASCVSSISGLITFGLTPAVGARFFVYFCGMPPELHVGQLCIPTYAVVMVLLMGLSLFFALTGGQISVMVTDCVEGLISSVFYLLIAYAVYRAVSLEQMKAVFLEKIVPGESYINPFDIDQRPVFNGWYVILVLIFNVYIFRGQAWNQGFNAAAKTPHEGKMAGLVSYWRAFGPAAMLTMACIGAFTLMRHPDFAVQQQQVNETLSHIDHEQLRTQMTMPMALGILLGPGFKGAFCAIGLFGLLSSQGVSLHGIGSTFLQDVILPLRKKSLSPKRHLLALQLSTVGVGVFACVFSLFYKPADYLTLVVTLISAIYLGGVGIVVWGGLYWKRGTTAGAWAAMIVGTSLAVVFNILQPGWSYIQPHLLAWAGNGRVGQYLIANPNRCPIDGQQFSVGTAVCATLAYVIVSLLTYKKDFDMDQMLHRGKYAIASEEWAFQPKQKGFSWSKVIGIDEHYTTGDKILAVATFCYAMAWKPVTLANVLWWVFYGRQSDHYWFNFNLVTTIIGFVIALITTVWLAIGTIRDLMDMFQRLRVMARNDAEDGTVREHQLAGEEGPRVAQEEAVMPAGDGKER